MSTKQPVGTIGAGSPTVLSDSLVAQGTASPQG